MYLLDTNVISELRKRRPHGAVVTWLERVRDLLVDALIAATAVVHDLLVVTRNVRDFKALGIEALDPFKSSR